MLRWIVILAALCAASLSVGFAYSLSPSSTLGGMSLVVFAICATLLIGSFEAYETEARPAEGEDR